MPKVRIIHEDKDTTQSLNVTMGQGKQVVSVAAGGDYEFDLPAGSTVDIAVQKTEHPNSTMLQRIGDMLHFRHDTAAGKLNAGKQPSPAPAEVGEQSASNTASNTLGAQTGASTSLTPTPESASSNTLTQNSGEAGNGANSASANTGASPSQEPVTGETAGQAANTSAVDSGSVGNTAPAPATQSAGLSATDEPTALTAGSASAETGAEKAPE